jgi:hypothetical protein
VRFSVVLTHGGPCLHTAIYCVVYLAVHCNPRSKKSMYARQTGQQAPCHSHAARFNGRRSDAKQRSIDSLTTTWPFLALGSIWTARTAICWPVQSPTTWMSCVSNSRQARLRGMPAPLQNVFESKAWVPGRDWF